MARALKSNYDQFIKRIRDLPDMLDEASYFAVEEVMDQMCEYIKNEIKSNREIWYQEYGGVDPSLGDDVEYEIDNNVGTLYIGRNTKTIEMNDGRQVNPYLFIQFGYGIRGQNNPVRYHYQRNWQYNINNHTKAWWFIGTNGEPRPSYGRIGIDFLYRAMQKFRPELKAAMGREISKKINKR